MKTRPRDKKAGVIILAALIVISLVDIIFRAVAMGEAVFTTANHGEQLALIVLAVTILILNAKGKDRTCYICYGAWIAYFIFDQFFEFPGMIGDLLSNISSPVITLSIVLRLITMVCIVVIGVMPVEYMSDGTICKRAFNALCLIALLLFAVDIFWCVYQLAFVSAEGTARILM